MVKRETFYTWANHFHEKAHDRDNGSHDVWIVKVLFCALCYLNDGKYRIEDKASELERVRNAVKYCGILPDAFFTWPS